MAKTKRIEKNGWGVFDRAGKLQTAFDEREDYLVCTTEEATGLWITVEERTNLIARPVTISWEVDE